MLSGQHSLYLECVCRGRVVGWWAVVVALVAALVAALVVALVGLLFFHYVFMILQICMNRDRHRLVQRRRPQRAQVDVQRAGAHRDLNENSLCRLIATLALRQTKSSEDVQCCSL